MDTTDRPRRQRGLVATTVLLAATLVTGVLTAPAGAATTPSSAPSSAPTLPKIGPRPAPFSPRTHTAAPSTTQASDVDAANYPWIVAIQSYYETGSEFCVGSIISPTKVLTAAACDVPPTLGRIAVIAGRTEPTDDSVGFVDGVASVWTDIGYIPNDEVIHDPSDDVQVLTLTLPLPSVYTPIPMSAEGDQTPYVPGTPGYTLSYGYGPQVPGDELIEVPTTSTGTDFCNGVFQREACVSYPGGGGAMGALRNLGDPLVVNGQLVGVGDQYPDNSDVNKYLQFEQIVFFHDVITADMARTDPGTKDWTGDGISDVLGEGQNGQLTYYEGYGAYPGHQPTPGFAKQALVDQTDWNADRQLSRVNNWTYNGSEGLLTVAPNGVLSFYPNTASGGIDYAHGVVVGAGWNQFGFIVPTNNFTGDGRPDLLAVRPDGTLWLYERTGNGWVNGSGVRIGSGFNQFTSLLPFQWTDTGHIGLLGVTPGGDLRFYGTDGGGHWVNGGGAVIGTGFAGFRSVFSVGSFGGTDTGTLMTIDQAGHLKVYFADGTGGWLEGNGIGIGVGFQTLKSVF